ncbi:MAG TPA: hypothetical protein VFD03_03745 [Clostridia bacterium]|nr:hypothetical protein [Clostridia bacterium]
MIQLNKKQAEEKMELVYIEMPSGFHIGIDFSYIDQVGDFKLTLPTGEILDTADIT